MAPADLHSALEAVVNLITAQVLAVAPPPYLSHHIQAVGTVGQSYTLGPRRRVTLSVQSVIGVVTFLGSAGDIGNPVQVLNSLPPVYPVYSAHLDARGLEGEGYSP